jgi:hypothetical protein
MGWNGHGLTLDLASMGMGLPEIGWHRHGLTSICTGMGKAYP